MQQKWHTKDCKENAQQTVWTDGQMDGRMDGNGKMNHFT